LKISIQNEPARKPRKKMGSVSSDSDSYATDPGDISSDVKNSGKSNSSTSLKSSGQKKRKKKLGDPDTDSEDDVYEQKPSIPSSKLPIETNSNEIKISKCISTHQRRESSIIDPYPSSQTVHSSSIQKLSQRGTIAGNDEQISEQSSCNIADAGSAVNSSSCSSSSSNKTYDSTSNSNDGKTIMATTSKDKHVFYFLLSLKMKEQQRKVHTKRKVRSTVEILRKLTERTI
jgi:uncharacterized protein (DUF2147 family)